MNLFNNVVDTDFYLGEGNVFANTNAKMHLYFPVDTDPAGSACPCKMALASQEYSQPAACVRARTNSSKESSIIILPTRQA